jgi:DNA-binding transcriptional ArsR family regulator
MSEWSFLTNHARVLLCIADDPGVRLRDIGTALDITERSAYAIVNDLTEAGYVLKERDGRRNRYIVQQHLPIPETTVRERTVGEVLELLIGRKPRTRTASAQKATRSVRARTVTKRAKSTTKRK